MSESTLPAILEGTVFRPKALQSKADKPMLAFSLAVNAGKNQDGTYRKGPSVDVTVVGRAASQPLPAERSRVRVAGFLEQREFTRKDGTAGSGLAMTALELMDAPRIDSKGDHGQPAKPAAKPAPSKPAAAAKPAASRLDDFEDDGTSPF